MLLDSSPKRADNERKMEVRMQIVLKHNLYRVKNGYAAQSPELALTAHGYSPKVARQNLERVGLLFLKPFEREGNLKAEIRLLGLRAEGDTGELMVSTAD